MTGAASAEVAAARSQIYALMAAIFRRPLDAGQIEALRAPQMLAALEAAGIDPGEAFRSADVEALRHELAVEFTHLFHDPEGKIMPYEGMMLAHEDELHGRRAEDVERFLADVGYRVPPRTWRDGRSHIGRAGVHGRSRPSRGRGLEGRRRGNRAQGA